jgi:UTP--glucose-1-phosphate uridylyltransferase
MSSEGLRAAIDKMTAGGVDPTAIDVFAHYYALLEAGETGIVAETDIEPLTNPPRLADLSGDEDAGRDALDQTVVIKLNGGLGTGMGMDKAKSLLTVRDGLTFIDIVARQVLHIRKSMGVRLPLMFLNSFRTRDDTLAALAAYEDLPVEDLPLDLLQNREPKLVIEDLKPVSWPGDPSLEWCPPGHGDIYTVLYSSGTLRRLLDTGMRYAFLSNGDNLCATADARVAGWFAQSGAPFASEVCRRTAADRKGGHLAIRRRDQQLVLRDSAQTAPDDEDAFADITRHRFFNANNLWIDLRAMARTLDAKRGVLGLQLIRNVKTVDPADPSSTVVVQVETAMGAAIEVFPGAQAIEVDRDRFLPVKSTNDLLALRSDVYTLGDDYTIALADGLVDAPFVDLDPDYYKLVHDFERRFPGGPPSLVGASSLRVAGDWTFGKGVVITGDTSIESDGSPGTITPDSAVRGR